MVKLPKYVLICACLLLVSVSNLAAQNLSGKVLSNYGDPVMGAYVIHISTEHHAHTNEFGDFLLGDVKMGDSLLITHIGFQSQYIRVEDPSQKLKIQLVEDILVIDEIVIEQDINAINQVIALDLKANPVNSSQDILRRVPGLIIGQHAGGGKAEQIFLRGFDIDHGTDINITVDGLPVNMVSHAHGQGYADLHFVIPETIDNIDFGKGPYYAQRGNFTTAGYAAFETKNRLENSFFKTEIGSFNYFRNVGMFNLVNSENHNAYVAAEYTLTDGPFESSQNFNRLNLMAKYTGFVSNRDRISILVSHFDSKWDASGQIPQRAVDSGLISRFGAIDDREGGTTSRTNVALTFTRNMNQNTFVRNRAFYSHYDFELFSNFTFFLEDPVNGDQIRQKESRDILGFESELNHFFDLGSAVATFQLGAGLRYDNVDGNELSRTRNRTVTLENIALGDVDETNFYAYANLEFELGKFLINPALRFDYFKFDNFNLLADTIRTQSETEVFLSPKLNIIYNYNNNLQFYLKGGMGFHSNDTRVVVAQNGEEILPAAYGADFGVIWKPFPRLWVNAGYWYLFLEQEFVYVGDAGIVEPSGESRRTGFDFGMRYQALDWLFLDTDVSYTHARSVNEPEGAQFIPLAPDLTVTGGVTVRKGNFTGAVRVRHVADRPANEDNSIVAIGYTITDLNLNYQLKKLNFGIFIENLFDRDWNETQFATESRLQNETEPVEEIHFTPGTPFSVRGSLKYSF